MDYKQLLVTLNEIKISDFSNGKGISNLTSGFMNDREREVGPSRRTDICQRAGFADNYDDIVFEFITPAGSDGDITVNAKTFKHETNRTGHYSLWILVVGALTALKEIRGDKDQELKTDRNIQRITKDIEEPVKTDINDRDFHDAGPVEGQEEEETINDESPLEGTRKKESRLKEDIGDNFEITNKEMKALLNNCDIQVWSNSPAFYDQGLAYNLSKKNGVIYPNNIVPKKWNAPNLHAGVGLLDKHLALLIKDIPYFYGQMAERVKELLSKSKGKIDF